MNLTSSNFFIIKKLIIFIRTERMKVPEEVKIADVPVSRYQASQFFISRENSMEVLSNSFVHSNNALGAKHKVKILYIICY